MGDGLLAIISISLELGLWNLEWRERL